MNILGSRLYDPAVAVLKSTAALLAMTPVDTTNLRLTVTVPAHGFLFCRIRCVVAGSTSEPQVLLGVMNGATVVGRVLPAGASVGTGASKSTKLVAEFAVPGLTPGSITVDAAYGVEDAVASSAIKFGGPNNATMNDAWGAFVFEVWDPRPLPIVAPGAAGGVFIAGTNANTTVNFSGSMSGSVGSVTAPVSVAGIVDTNIVSVATDAIDANSLAADAVVKIQDGLASQLEVESVRTLADERLPGELIDGKMNSTFSLETAVDANIVAVAGVEVIGTGVDGDTWRPNV